jgi:peptide deformylase
MMEIPAGKQVIKLKDGMMYEFFLYEIVDQYNPILRKKTVPFDFSNSEIRANVLAASLAETMAKKGGIGLAANQVGIPYRVFAMALTQRNLDKSKLSIIVMFNPEITSFSEKSIKNPEGCLSFPNLNLEIERPYSITISFQTQTQESMTMELSGLDARCALHEIDHLDGVLFTSKVKPVALKRAQERARKEKKSLMKRTVTKAGI